jgi:hypothetical protein
MGFALDLLATRQVLFRIYVENKPKKFVEFNSPFKIVVQNF